jgi:hypothetical protein
MPRARYLRTNEHEEAVRSLEYAAVQASLITNDPYNWKWVLISMHNAVQGFMVLSLWNGNGLLSLRPDVAAKWLKANESGASYPAEWLDSFLNLYRKVKDQTSFHVVGAGPFCATGTHDKSMERLNEFRNEFIHFTPKGWSLELAGLPSICLDALDLIQFFGWNSTAILWHKKSYVMRSKRAVKHLQKSLTSLSLDYSSTR